MGHFVLTVEFEVTRKRRRFHTLIAENARKPVANRPGCPAIRRDAGAGPTNRILLYEVYDDVAAFEAHTTMPRRGLDHFLTSGQSSSAIDGNTWSPGMVRTSFM